MGETLEITGSFLLDWDGNREATLLEQQRFLQKWPCVCAKCHICKLILTTLWEDEEE